MNREFLKRSETNPGAVLNTDSTGLQAYKKRKEILKKKDDRIQDLESRINNLEHLFKEMIKNK